MFYAVNDSLIVDKLYFNFLPSWCNKNYGICLGEKFFFDADYRVKIIMELDRIVAERLPSLHIGSKNPKPQVIQPELHNAVTPAAAGCEIIYPDDAYPCNGHISDDEILQLQPVTHLLTMFPYNEIVSQVNYLNRKLNTSIQPFIHPRGPLNDSILIKGFEFFGDLLNPNSASKHLMNFCFSISSAAIKHDRNDFGFNDLIWLANCTTEMIGPNTYNKLMFDYDAKLYDLITRNQKEFGIHHCGLFDTFVETYRKFKKIDWLEIGSPSDIKKALAAFPETTIQYIINTRFLQKASLDQVQQMMQEILESAKSNLHRLRLHVADIEYGTPDETLTAIYKTCKKTAFR